MTELQLTSQLAPSAQSRIAVVAEDALTPQLEPPAHAAMHVVALLHAS